MMPTITKIVTAPFVNAGISIRLIKYKSNVSDKLLTKISIMSKDGGVTSFILDQDDLSELVATLTAVWIDRDTNLMDKIKER